MPNTKSDRDRGYIGAWMRRERLGRGWDPERVRDELAKRGTKVRADYLRQIEARTAGRVPGPDLLNDLVALYGSRPEPFPEDPVVEREPQADDVAAAIREVAVELRKLHEDQRQSTAFLTDLLGVVAQLAAGQSGASEIEALVRARTQTTAE